MSNSNTASIQLPQKPRFSAIVAIDQKLGIGKNNDLPWHLPEDLKLFKTITTTTQDPSQQHAVIMGRNTWESIPDKFRPLPNRLNCILSRSPNYTPDQATVFNSLDTALEYLSNAPSISAIFVIGGAFLYKESIQDPRCQQLIVTELNNTYDCDTFFPDFKTRYTVRTHLYTSTSNTPSFHTYSYTKPTP